VNHGCILGKHHKQRFDIQWTVSGRAVALLICDAASLGDHDQAAIYVVAQI
jgi:hypothetical protein